MRGALAEDHCLHLARGGGGTLGGGGAFGGDAGAGGGDFGDELLLDGERWKRDAQGEQGRLGDILHRRR